ncbi:1-(5-phosphoribosyl)-5-[(5-phosphoribosylamino)methylideneamino]imidazole-4-carboxamide isomerase [Candidatus Synechococcus calcipolaris G9]|uniref:1-(5-phosphoribosyl)-5-[(5-phosphoribosylamino)methylideneamino] imidazole-4-carboxamide isomerase n=1 Tax=Candidatus Synechococcus calcipolaris G9 TaxID=1497997 RepID=A0ABT6F2V8_9SYNE|nr:1-(5-phosphoribosyl)-5-[(5-phosphoribosylamino)methylideneamino]imidazole-4-carboxamide isomerase [Candidatus Synechococcus calcipolaris]MDG2992208.1 1-(5-phosphoribosyl)-5-[(5-phosphoribosylamino)methylideneamino]imidazole-4-carboxamide isomerase [Candidatus Synechococcus calcipolaris G9]
MDIIPAIDLLGGQCVRLFQGDYNQVDVFDSDPVQVAFRWQSQGAPRLHLVDLDGAKSGQPINHGAIASLVKALNIPVQVGGGLRTWQQVTDLLSLGVERAILGTIALENPQLVQTLAAEFPGQIWVGIDARNGFVATRGWLETSEINAIDLAQQMANLGVAGIIYTDIYRDGTMQGPNIDALRQLLAVVNVPVIASGGISSLTDILNLFPLHYSGLVGAIVGRALYTDALSLPEAVRAVGQGRWQDVPPDLGSSAWA